MSLSPVEDIMDVVQETFFPSLSSSYRADGRIIPYYVGGSEAYQEVKASIQNYAAYVNRFDENLKKTKKKKMPPPLLILGETGTGKTALVRFLRELLPERNQHYTAPNVRIQNPEMVRAELFGHKKGSHNQAKHDKEGHFSKAHNGILFIDEIGAMPLSAQAQILTSIEDGSCWPLGAIIDEGPKNVLVVAATREELTDHKIIREDLKYRFMKIITIPPLRDRKEDIPYLLQHFLVEENVMIDSDRSLKTDFDKSAVEELLKYEWPDNARGIKKVVAHLYQDFWFNDPGKCVQEEHIARLVEKLGYSKKISSTSDDKDERLSKTNCERDRCRSTPLQKFSLPNTCEDWQIMLDSFPEIKNWPHLSRLTGLHKDTLRKRYNKLAAKEPDSIPPLPFVPGENRVRESSK